jgi:hypothetical protein
VVLGLVVLVALAWFLFLRGDADEAVSTAPVVTPAPAPTTEPTEKPAEKPGKGPIETFEVFAPKDPFRPLIAAASGGTAPAPAPAGAPTVSPTAAPGVGQPSGGSDISGGGGGDNSVGGHRVRLVDTFRVNGEPRARVQVDGTVYTVGEGDRFADNFEVLSISGSCTSLLFGDDQFSLCEGEEILK